MQILNSEWLIKMLQKSGTRPDLRLLSLFDILSDWLEAPQIYASLKIEAMNNDTPYLLLNYLSEQAQEAGAAMPEMLAEHLIFIAKSALKDRVENAECASFAHAKQVANALISAQCEREAIQLKKSTIYSALAIFVGAITIGALIYTHPQSDSVQNNISSAMFEQSNTKNDDDVAGNPKETADMYASIETMRGGDCQYIEALQIPDADKKIYLENVVGGQVPTNVHDQLIAQRYLQKIRCNYTPMLMKNSTN
jgi:hypothetical protein